MGSFGCWVQCYWCEQQTWDPYFIDCLSHPLCDGCMDHFELWGVPPRPNAVDHRTSYLLMVLMRHWMAPPTWPGTSPSSWLMSPSRARAVSGGADLQQQQQQQQQQQWALIC